MKRGIVAIAAFFYLIFSIGLWFNIHYCKGNVSSISLYASQSSCCCPPMMKGCCADETILLQIQDEQKITEKTELSIHRTVANSLATFIELFRPDNNLHENRFSYFPDRPPPPKVPIYQANCALTFYG